MGLIPLKLASSLTAADLKRINTIGQKPPDERQPRVEQRSKPTPQAVAGNYFLRRRVLEVDGIRRSSNRLSEDSTRNAMHEIRDLFDKGYYVKCAKLCKAGIESYKVTVHPAYSTYVHFYAGLADFIRSQSFPLNNPKKLVLLKQALSRYEEASGFLEKAKEVEGQDDTSEDAPPAEEDTSAEAETSERTYTECAATFGSAGARNSHASVSSAGTGILYDTSPVEKSNEDVILPFFFGPDSSETTRAASPPTDATAPAVVAIERPAKRDYKNRFYNKSKAQVPQAATLSSGPAQSRPRDSNTAVQPIRDSAASTEAESIFSFHLDDESRRSSAASADHLAPEHSFVFHSDDEASDSTPICNPKKRVTFASSPEIFAAESPIVAQLKESHVTPHTHKFQAGLLTPPTISPANADGSTSTSQSVSPIALNFVPKASDESNNANPRPLPPIPSGPPRRPLPPLPVRSKPSSSAAVSKEHLYNSPTFPFSTAPRTPSPLSLPPSQPPSQPPRRTMPALPLGIRVASPAPSLRVHSHVLPLVKSERKARVFNASISTVASDDGFDRPPSRPTHAYEKRIPSTSKPMNFSRPMKRQEQPEPEPEPEEDEYNDDDRELICTSEQSITLFILQSSAARYQSTISILQTRLSHHTAEVKAEIARVQYTLAEQEATRIRTAELYPHGKPAIKTITLQELKNNKGWARGVQWKVPKDEIARRVRRHETEKLKKRGEGWEMWKGERYQELCRIANEELEELEDRKRVFCGEI